MTRSTLDPADRAAARLAAESGGALDACVGTADGAVLLARHRFGAAAGGMGSGAGVRIGLLDAGGGPLYQRTALGRIERPWRPGVINVALPGCHGEYRSPPLDLLGLVIDPARLSGAGVSMEGLHAAAADLHDDPVVASVLWALWHCAQAHAASTAFFDHGVDIVLQRLSRIGGREPLRTSPVRALSPARVRRVHDFIEHGLGEDLSVAGMAGAAGLDSSSFSRRFRQATGMTPYAYLTWRRMEAAKTLLLAGRAVTEVALAVGYANPGKFAAAFRRVVGHTPSAWRR